MISFLLRSIVAATGIAVGVASAAPFAYAASFDGPWSVVVYTRQGPCDPTYRYGITISNGIVYYAGGGAVSLTGRVAPSGAVSVRVSSGPQYAVGTGRLRGSSGGGSWRGQGPSGACAGSWAASRG